MVRRSLVFKTYAYAVGVFLLMLVAAFSVGRLLISQGQAETWRELAADHAAFIGAEAEASFRAGRPDPERLVAIGRLLHSRLHFVPWSEADAYPAALKTTKVLAPHPLRRVWVRLDLDGKPRGALRIEPLLHGPHRWHAPALAALGLMTLFGIMIVPPLFLWVLRPLRNMVAVAHRLSEGQLDTPVTLDRTDEFGELERAFERLRERILMMLAQKERLLTDISHELRGPLSRMAIALPLAQADGNAEPFFDALKREIAAMEALIQELLDAARGRATVSTSVPLDLAALAHELVAFRRLAAEEKGLTLSLALEPAPTRGDERLLARAMGNLLDNALKYVPPGGHVAIATFEADGSARFRVEDDGPGIPAEAQSHLFEPFYRADASRTRETGGVGLGLAIVKAIAEGHGGTASLASRPEGGAIAELRLPGQGES